MENPVRCSLGRLSVYGSAVTLLANTAGDFKHNVVVTGHYDEPSSADCRWVEGSFMQFDVSDAPVATAQFTCRTRFYVVEVSVR